MKNFALFLFLIMSGKTISQCYTSLTQSQNKLLDKYHIDYTGLQTRYIMSTNQINRITDKETKEGMIQSYNDFLRWKNPETKILPDTTSYFFTGSDYIKNKDFMPDSELITVFFNSNHRVLQTFHFDINEANIKSIEILECHSVADTTCMRIFHMVFIENKDGYWQSFTSDDNDATLECPYCTVP